MDKSEKLIIVGASGSGKDYLLRGLISKNLKYNPKLTTRPKRLLEKEGIDYNFIDKPKFEKLIESNEIKVYQHITDLDWYYAITSENFNNNQLFIMTPHEISTIEIEDRKKCFIVYLDIEEEVRRSRISRRNDNNDSVERRINSDREDFKNFRDYDLRITDPDFDVDMIYELMM